MPSQWPWEKYRDTWATYFDHYNWPHAVAFSDYTELVGMLTDPNIRSTLKHTREKMQNWNKELLVESVWQWIEVFQEAMEEKIEAPYEPTVQDWYKARGIPFV
jgi:hypothetical protein